MVDDESSILHSGTYREIDRPHRLVFTWSSPVTHFRESIVTVTFKPSSGSTVVEIHQVGLPDEAAQNAHHGGWSDALRQLDHFEPGVFGWPEQACRGCSMVADQVAHVSHLNARDTTLVFASRAPQPDIERVKARMDWEMPWYTITDEFDKDLGVDEWHGTNVFIRNGDSVFRT